MHTVEKILAAAADFRHQWTTRHHLTQQTGFHHSAMAVSKHTVTRVLLNNNSINNNKNGPTVSKMTIRTTTDRDSELTRIAQLRAFAQYHFS